MTAIVPTPGRIVWFHKGPGDWLVQREQPLAAIVTYVWNDRMVNLSVFDAQGSVFARTSIPLVQDGDTVPAGSAYAEWMPYQKGQASKTEALEAKLDPRRK
jgi:predicted deacylase